MIRPFIVGLNKMSMSAQTPAPALERWDVHTVIVKGDSFLVLPDGDGHDYKIKLPSVTIEPGTTPMSAATDVAAQLGLLAKYVRLRTIWIDADDEGGYVRNFVFEMMPSNTPRHKDYSTSAHGFYHNPNEDLGKFDATSIRAFEMIDLQGIMDFGIKAIEDAKSIKLFREWEA